MRNRLPTIAAVGVLALLTVACVSFMTRAEQAEMSSFLVLDRFVALEKANSAALEAAVPGAHALANKIRTDAPDLLRAYDNALAAYRLAPGEGTKGEVLRIMALVAQLAQDAQAIMAKWEAR